MSRNVKLTELLLVMTVGISINERIIIVEMIETDVVSH